MSSNPAGDNDRSRIDVMNRLVGIFQRNLRVRYEINLAEVVQA